MMANAVVVTKFGGFDSLQVHNVPVLDCGTEEVVVNVKACGMNFADVYMRQGFIRGAYKPPFVLGLESAGIVEAVGTDVTNFKKGDRVMCYSPTAGMMAEKVCIPAERCYLMPDAMTFDEGAAILINYGTAHAALFGFGGLRPNQVVFTHSIGGGVGCAVIQLAKSVPGVEVVGTASPEKHEATLKIGAHRVFNYTDYKEQLTTLYPQGVDIFLDNISGSEFNKSLAFLRPLGKLIHIGAVSAIKGEQRNLLAIARTWWGLKRIDILDLMTKNSAVAGLHLSEFYKQDPIRFNQSIAEILKLYDEGIVKPQIDSTWPFSSIQKATELLTKRRNIGKVILVPSEEETQ